VICVIFEGKRALSDELLSDTPGKKPLILLPSPAADLVICTPLFLRLLSQYRGKQN
jgi:hypothetical protein